MAELSRKRLQATFVSTALSISGLAVVIYFVAVGGGVAKSTAAIFTISTFVLAMGALASAAFNYARNPNYQPRLNPKWYFYLSVPLVFFVLAEMFYLAAGVVVAVSVGILAAAGLTVPKPVVEILSWISLAAGLISAAMFIRWAWRRFNRA